MALSKCQRDMEEYGPNPSLQALGEGNPFLQILAGVKSMGAYATCLSAGIQKDRDGSHVEVLVLLETPVRFVNARAAKELMVGNSLTGETKTP
ncbi:hypothetical protein AK812_SmicGene8615 [Symbiodinium microadriaticum]|uniref:Uncharacterized protein n=1 Tax=Symbiodinium microadriaticum TaxID=2951 RepID=A0A1Q9EKG9_SYMMI|nr:hypothetical protein AK812_SmicGene8615 [Symbiodinium microadriaticum]